MCTVVHAGVQQDKKTDMIKHTLHGEKSDKILSFSPKIYYFFSKWLFLTQIGCWSDNLNIRVIILRKKSIFFWDNDKIFSNFSPVWCLLWNKGVCWLADLTWYYTAALAWADSADATLTKIIGKSFSKCSDDFCWSVLYAGMWSPSGGLVTTWLVQY